METTGLNMMKNQRKKYIIKKKLKETAINSNNEKNIYEILKKKKTKKNITKCSFV